MADWLNSRKSTGFTFLLDGTVELKEIPCIYVDLGIEGVLAPLFLLQDDE